MSWIVLIGFVICLVYSFYIAANGVQLLNKERHSRIDQLPDVSIVIPFRNEMNKLPGLLRSLSFLDYPNEKLEIILINDHSTDGWERLALDQFDLQLKTINCNGIGKKAALSEGIALATNEIIMQTDADCIVPSTWINSMLNALGNNDMVCGSVLFSNSKLQNLELFAYQGLGKSTLKLKAPIIANGANMAYRKTGFIEVGGFENNKNISSGDDVFLLRSFAKEKKRIVYLLSDSARVSTESERHFFSIIKQRIRWAGKTKSTSHIGTIAAGVILVLTNFYVCLHFILWLILDLTSEVADIVILIKFSIDGLFLFLAARQLKSYGPLLYLPIAIPLYSLYIVLIAFLCVFIRPEWKNRKIQI
jgi:poly-beta-1,6-N-acetyl-D-glucosamine synthase